jgi:DNA polymerase III epsilon subunit-like protein
MQRNYLVPYYTNSSAFLLHFCFQPLHYQRFYSLKTEILLNPNYRYIGIDFETTGLDTQKDVPIQVGIVELTANGEIIDTFESLIRPQKDIKELKNIVHFITKIEVAQLVFAPTIEEIRPQIEHFF